MKNIHSITIYMFITAISIIVACGFNDKESKKSGPKLLENAKAGDCPACHNSERVLPIGHEITTDLTLSECDACHYNEGENGKRVEMRGKITLSHLHLLSDVSCADCHGDVRPATSISTDDCYSCHEDLEGLISLTSDIDPNPHDGHYGDLDCDVCHKQHAASINFCNTEGCHDFDYLVP